MTKNNVKIYPHCNNTPKYISIPAFRNIKYNIHSILQKYNYFNTNNGGYILKDILINIRPKIKTEQKSGVYEIRCEDCREFYKGMITRSASTPT